MSNRVVTKIFSYQLTFGNTIDNQAKGKLMLQQRSTQVIKIGKTLRSITLNGVKFNRKIYQPGVIEAEIQIKNWKDSSELPTSSEIKDFFIMRDVTLHVIQKDDSGYHVTFSIIAANYYVHELNPQLFKQASGGLTLAVKLTAYSMDKLMTLDKYSKVYVAKKLGSDILEPESKAFGYAKTNNHVTTNRDHLRHLKYTQSVNVPLNGKEVPVQFSSEFIHPYLVQYNETFYDFMARTANRCGEFLYFEDGKLVLGLDETSEEPYVIDSFNTVTGQQLSASPLKVDEYARDSMKDGIDEPKETNYTRIKKNAAGFPNDAFPFVPAYNAELSADEYYFPLYADKFDSLNREWNYVDNVNQGNASMAFMLLKDIASSNTDPVGILTNEAYEKSKLAIISAKNVNDINESGRKNYIEKYQYTEFGCNRHTVPFGTVSSDGWTTLRYHADVRRYEEAQQRETICIDMGTSYIPFRLGELIKVKGMEETFVIIQIREVSNEMWLRDYEKYGHDGSDQYSNKQSLKIFAIPLAEINDTDTTTVKKPFPPVLLDSPIRKAEPQTAFVTDNNDPKYQGRVRIVYPWQAVNLPERRALADAEEALEEAQKNYDEKKAEYDAYQKALEEWKKSSADDIDSQITKLDTSITRYENLKSYCENDLPAKVKKEISLFADTISVLQGDTDTGEDAKTVGQKAKDKLDAEVDILLKELQGESLLKTTATTKKEIDKLYDDKVKELEDKKNITEDEEKTLLNLQCTKYLYDLLTEASVIFDPIKEEAKMEGYIQDYVKLLEEELSRYNEKASQYDHAIQAANNSKAKLEEEKEIVGKENEFKNKHPEVTESDVSAKQKALTDAQEKLEKAQKAVNSKAEEYKEKINTLASPWIRVATPMATEGGGVFFKPMVGDEVLVNYDNGNIERPYVVGSLFSKNTLVPDERNSRTMGSSLQGGASIAIVSPNGHGITFKDPGDANGFVSSVSPAIGTIQKFAKIPMDGTDKDMAGGIRIGDRYGLYSLDMSSDKRSVKISSSLGTVKLDAFTGITISAPNGDIKIEGKNVTINAGNNLTLNSGMNIDVSEDIKKKVKGEKVLSSLSSTIQSKLLDEFTLCPVDLNLVRTMLQTILKPVGGTMTIKSKRYLKLEAGAGEAKVQKDRYNNKKTNMGDSESKYKDLVQIIEGVNASLTNFIKGYPTLWNTAYSNKMLLKNALKHYYNDGQKTVENKVKDIMNSAWGVSTAPAQVWSDPYPDNNSLMTNLSVLSPKQGQAPPDDNGKEYLRILANKFALAVYDLHKHVDSFDRLVQNLLQITNNPLKPHAIFAFNTINQSASAYFSSKYVMSDRLLSNQAPDSQDRLISISDMKGFKRKFAIKFLQTVAADPTLSPNIKLGRGADKFGGQDLDDQFKWTRFAMNLGKLPTSPYWKAIAGDGITDLINKPMDFIQDYFSGKFKNLYDDEDVWDGSKSGQILFSDDEASTVHIEGNRLVQEQAANKYNLDHLKEILLGL